MATSTAMHGWGTEILAFQSYMGGVGVPGGTAALRLYHLRRAAAGLEGSPWALTFDALVAWLGAQGWGPNTRRSYRTSLRAFYAWGMATGRTRVSPAHQLPPVRVPRGRPRPTPEAAYRAALEAADDRVGLAIRLAAQCALRRSEVAAVHSDDLERDLAGWCLRVAGKGGHVRLVPLPDDLAADLAARPAGWVFPSSHGGHLTPAHLGKLIAAVLPGDLTTHTLRHRAATMAYAATHDLRAVQEFLGHSKPETTAIYTLVPDDAVRAAMLGAAA